MSIDRWEKYREDTKLSMELLKSKGKRQRNRC